MTPIFILSLLAWGFVNNLTTLFILKLKGVTTEFNTNSKVTPFN